MITRIEIDGFKTFKDFTVELAPFQVIVGPNGSGKSNLFDALHLLSRLADTDILSAFQDLRGNPDEQFMLLSDGKRADHIRIAVEMLVDKKVKDEFGKEAELKYRRLRYEITLSSVQKTVYEEDVDGNNYIAGYTENIHVIYESLKSILYSKDHWLKKYANAMRQPEEEEKQVIFIDTDSEGGSVYVHDEWDSSIQIFLTEFLPRIVLSGMNNIMLPHHVAAREELRSLQFLHLNPESLRQSSSLKAPSFLSVEGKNLPSMIARMQREDKFFLNDITRDLANLVPNLSKLSVERHAATNTYEIWATDQDGRKLSAQVLSDGTLLLLAIATLYNDPDLHGVLCLEEPENSVQPLYLENVAHLLRKMATDLDDPKQLDEPLRQILITTHSSAFITQPDVIDSLLFTYMVTRVEPHKYVVQITRMVPVVTSDAQSKLPTDIDRADESYTLHQIEKYLDSNNFDDARAKLGRK